MGTVLSENQQRLQGRERELKDMKKVLDTLTVNIYHIQGKKICWFYDLHLTQSWSLKGKFTHKWMTLVKRSKKGIKVCRGLIQDFWRVYNGFTWWTNVTHPFTYIETMTDTYSTCMSHMVNMEAQMCMYEHAWEPMTSFSVYHMWCALCMC